LREFYESVFGWKFTKWGGFVDYRPINTGSPDEPGINGGLVRRESKRVFSPNTINVSSIDESPDKIGEIGGKILMPKTTIAGVGYPAYFKDPEGNVFGVIEQDETSEKETGEFVEHSKTED
jgi:hypothetical protein